ncbi:MAG TPA: HNH endonuclease [Candidatus Acidoferrum sp.]|jgi:hypothetical protein|nr:HNH endonuclease [Candidatus Acidoferrum sp.]
MKNTKIDAARVWKHFHDDLVPQLRLSVVDRAVYSHLFRHTHLEGKPRLRFSLAWLGHGVGLTPGTARLALHRLIHTGALRLIECSKDGHVVQVRLPKEIRGVRLSKMACAQQEVSTVNLEETDFLHSSVLRLSIHRREAGRCFYCLRRVVPRRRCLDHVVPRAKLGRNSYRNLVSACDSCNTKKRASPAEEFLRWLFRERKLNSAELRIRFRALRALKAGKLIPKIDSSRLATK